MADLWKARGAAAGAGFLLLLAASLPALAQPAELTGFAPLTGTPERITKDIAFAMQRFLLAETRNVAAARGGPKPVEESRARLRYILGVAGERAAAPGIALDATTAYSSLLAEGGGIRAHAVSWPALEGVRGEGLLLEPESAPAGNVIALPDAQWTPEMLAGMAPGVPADSQYARRLAAAGFRVLVPVVVDRASTWSATRDGWGTTPPLATTIPHREVVHRMAYQAGRTVTGYEVQRVLAAVDWFARERPALPLGIAGCGEGGRAALYAAALDPRIDAALVSGYYGPREELWREPLDRNVWGLLTEFGDAETAWLVAPRGLVVEAAAAPEHEGTPPSQEPRPRTAAPGSIRTPAPDRVRAEFERARAPFAQLGAADRLVLAESAEGRGGPGSAAALTAFAKLLGRPRNFAAAPAGSWRVHRTVDASQRMKRQFDELVQFTQRLVRGSDFRRREYWAAADDSSIERWNETARPYRRRLWEEVIGRLPDPSAPLDVRARLSYDEPKWKGWEVLLPVFPNVPVYGVLLVPKDLRPGERRPVVVCQHGLRGRPQQVADPRIDSAYHSFGARLADRGFIVFAPSGPHDGSDDYRVLTRMSHPIGKTLYSLIAAQHQRILEWLGTLPFADSSRVALYGLSFGGKTAMRVGALLEGYAAVICSGDFNEWTWKNTSEVHRISTVYTHAWETPEFDLAARFNHAEMAWLVAPRPFMVERGHHDTVAPDEWVAYEYARVRRHFVQLGVGGKTEIEFFNGPHEINGVGTFAFLERHLRWRGGGANW